MGATRAVHQNAPAGRPHGALIRKKQEMVARNQAENTNVSAMPAFTLAQAHKALDERTDDIPAKKLDVRERLHAMVLEYAEYQSSFDKGKTYQVATLRASDKAFCRLTIGAAAPTSQAAAGRSLEELSSPGLFSGLTRGRARPSYPRTGDGL